MFGISASELGSPGPKLGLLLFFVLFGGPIALIGLVWYLAARRADAKAQAAAAAEQHARESTHPNEKP